MKNRLQKRKVKADLKLKKVEKRLNFNWYWLFQSLATCKMVKTGLQTMYFSTWKM